jgi:hypothetical protein
VRSIIPGISLAVVIFLVLQMILPFPYGLILGLVFGGLLIRYVIKNSYVGKDSLLNFRRRDPITEKEKEQNDEALRILEKKYIEEKISKEEYLKRKKEFEDIEYNPRKCRENAKFVDQKTLNFYLSDGLKNQESQFLMKDTTDVKNVVQNEN